MGTAFFSSNVGQSWPRATVGDNGGETERCVINQPFLPHPLPSRDRPHRHRDASLHRWGDVCSFFGSWTHAPVLGVTYNLRPLPHVHLSCSNGQPDRPLRLLHFTPADSTKKNTWQLWCFIFQNKALSFQIHIQCSIDTSGGSRNWQTWGGGAYFFKHLY